MPTPPDPPAGAPDPQDPPAPEATLAEDLLLLLFQPASGTIAGEGTLFYVLAGALLAELALGGHVAADTHRGVTRVQANPDHPPIDPVLLEAWHYVGAEPRDVQTILPALGPTLRGRLLDRLIARGDLQERRKKILGLFPVISLVEGGTGRRPILLEGVRGALVPGHEGGVDVAGADTPTPAGDPGVVGPGAVDPGGVNPGAVDTGGLDPNDAGTFSPVVARSEALAALIHASGTLPQFDPEIPWTGPVFARARELAEAHWGGGSRR
ncbi:MAG: GOLPH3/VPS74 family protein [Pauljensenia sp.]